MNDSRGGVGADLRAVEVELDPSWRWRLGCLGLLLLPLAGLFGLGAINAILKGAGPAVVLALLCLASLGSFLYFPLHARRWVRRLDDKGVTLRDGQFLPWSEYKGLTRLLRGDTVKRYVLRFSSGDAHVVPLMIANYDAVRPVVERLLPTAAV